MAKNLVIVESPAKWKTIEKILWKDYKVVASMGHIRDLPVKNIWVDIKDNFKPNYEISSEKKSHVKTLKELSAKSETVWIATDEDREWEAIWWHLCQALNLDVDNTKRIVFHEITKTAITKAIKEPKKINIDLFYAQQARRVLDRLVWYKISPILWKKIRKWLSAWRVQSVTVKLIIERENQIKAFKPEESWKITTILDFESSSFWAVLNKVDWKVKKFKSESDVEKYILTLFWDIEAKEKTDKKGYKIKEISKKIDFRLISSTKKDSKRKPSPPFTTSTLQQEASRKFWFTLKKTMMLAQKLYEWIDIWEGQRQGLITYMRTDSLNLSAQATSQAKEVIESLFWEKYSLPKAKSYKTKSSWAQEAHEAIRPVDLTKTPKTLAWILDPQELKLYDLIWKRTLASQMQDALIEITNYVFSPLDREKDEWNSKWEVVKFEGFMKVYTEWKDDEDVENDWKSLPFIEENSILSSNLTTANQSFSKPPARYTEASIIKKLEEEWIWRPSTYAPTVTTIIDRWYVEKFEKKYLKPTEIAYLVNDFLQKHFEKMMDYKFTSKIEEDFDKIAVWEEKYEEMMDSFWWDLENDLKEADENAEKVVEKLWKACPKCWADLVYKYSKWWKFIWCSNYPECDFVDQLEEEKKQKEELESRYKWKKCSKCETWEMVIKNWRFWPFLACSNYPECKNIESIKDPKQEMIEELLLAKNMLVDEETWEELVVKNSKRWLFLAAKNYPKVKIAKPIPKEILKEADDKLNNN